MKPLSSKIAPATLTLAATLTMAETVKAAAPTAVANQSWSFSGVSSDGGSCSLQLGTDAAGKIDQLTLAANFYYTGALPGKTDADAPASPEVRAMIAPANAATWTQAPAPLGDGVIISSAQGQLQNGQSFLYLAGPSLDRLTAITAQGGVPLLLWVKADCLNLQRR